MKRIKLFVVVASVIEAIFSSAYISLMNFMANGFSNSNQYMNITKDTFCLIISLLNGIATFFSLSVDLLMYPMFIRVFIYFFKQYKIRNKIYRFQSREIVDNAASNSLPLNIKLRITLVLCLFVLNLVHSIYTHTLRIWQTVDPSAFIEI